MTTSKPSSAFKVELLRVVFKPTEKRLVAKVKVCGGFKEIFEYARKGMNLLGGGEGIWQ